jgi:ParB-like chromosome segregation protein Spo0J
MQPFQGDLKKRTDKDIDALCVSIQEDGLLMPFALWRQNDNLYILDGHGRYAALIKLALKDASILNQQFPVVIIDAEDENAARKALLQIVSTYGKVTKFGLTKFASSITDYKAPILSTLVKPIKYRPVDDAFEIIRIRVSKDFSTKVREILKNVQGVDVL